MSDEFTRSHTEDEHPVEEGYHTSEAFTAPSEPQPEAPPESPSEPLPESPSEPLPEPLPEPLAELPSEPQPYPPIEDQAYAPPEEQPYPTQYGQPYRQSYVPLYPPSYPPSYPPQFPPTYPPVFIPMRQPGFAPPYQPAFAPPAYDRPRYDLKPAPPLYNPWSVQPTAMRQRGGWKTAFFSLLLVVVFLAGAVLIGLFNEGVTNGQSQDPNPLPGPVFPWNPGEPETPALPPPSSGYLRPNTPGFGGQDPLDASGDTSLQIVDKPGGGGSAPPINGQSLTVAQIAERVLPSVVAVVGYWEDEIYSTGSGVIMTADGYIITNNHVVEYCDAITVVLGTGEEYDVVQCRTDRNTDLAVLKIDATGLTPAVFGNSDQMAVGDQVVAIGNPLGMELQSTVTNGIISAINRDIVIEDLRMTMLQTNCAINPGNSGGPLINEYGQVVGIISSKIMSDYYTVVEGLGFAIPSNTASPIINELISRGYVQGRPSIGIIGVAIDEYDTNNRGLPRGFQVQDISLVCDAYKQGMRVDDIITHVFDEEVYTVADINLIKNEYVVGDTITVTVYRPSQRVSFTISFKLMDSGELDW